MRTCSPAHRPPTVTDALKAWGSGNQDSLQHLCLRGHSLSAVVCGSEDTPLLQVTVRRLGSGLFSNRWGGEQRLDKPAPSKPSLTSEAHQWFGVGAPETTTQAVAVEGALPPLPPPAAEPPRAGLSRVRIKRIHFELQFL